MFSRPGRWIWTPSATPLQPKTWNAHFWITFNFWCSAGLVDGFEPHLPPLCIQKHEMLIFGLHSTSDDRPGWSMDSNPICHPSPVKKWNACFWITFNFWWLVGLVDRLEPHLPPLSSQKNEMLIFGLRSTSDDWPGWSMDLSPVCHLSADKKMKCSFLDYIQLLMIGQLVHGLEPHLPPLSSQKNEMLIFGLRSTSDDQEGWLIDSNPICHPSPAKKNEMLIFGLHSTFDDQEGWSMDLNPICHPSPATKMKCSFLDYIQLLMIGWAGRWTWALCVTSLQPKNWNAHFWVMFNFWWLAGLVDGLKPNLPPLSSQKNEMLVFGLPSTSDDWPGWSMDSNPIYHFSPAKKMKCSFLDYVQLLMIGWAGRWTWALCVTSLQPKKWNAHFWVTFNFWWLAGLVDGLEPHLPPLSSQKHEMLILKLCSTSDDWLGWLMDSNLICHPSPAKRMKCLFLDYLQLLMIGQAGRWTQTPSATPLQPKTWNAHFWITFNFWCSAGLVDGFEPHLPPLCIQKHEMLIFGLHSTSDDRPGWSMDSNPICHPSPVKKWNACFWITFNFWWSVGLVDGLEPHLPPLSSQKNEMLIFGLHSTSDDWPGWSMDLSPVCHLSADKKMKCSFLDYIQLLMIGQLVHGLEPHLPPLSSQKNEMLIFGLRSTSDDQEGWLIDSNPICHPFPAKKMKCSFLDYVQLLMIRRAGWSTQTPSATPLQWQKWNAHFWITFNFWWLAELVNGLKCHPPPLSSYKHEMLVFGLHSTSDDWPRWLMHSNPICHLSPAKKMKCSFLDYIQLLMIDQAGWWTWTPSTTSLQPQKWNAHF